MMPPDSVVAAEPRAATSDAGDLLRLSDDALLARFFQHHEEAAFAALLARHGSLVLGVCERILGRSADAEDAFQATFLVLVRKGQSLREPDRLANWLYGVAQRTARKFKTQAVSRGMRERQAIYMQSPSPQYSPTTREMTLPELRALLDEEISRLPEKYAAPLLLCYLEGKTNAQAAAQLGWPEGSISRRLARARELLRSRLAKRGLALSAMLIASVFSRSAEASVPPQLATVTLEASRRVAEGAAVEHVVSPAAAAVVKDVLIATKEGHTLAMAVAIAAIVVALVSIGWQLDAHAFAAEMLFPQTKGPHGMTLLPNGASSTSGAASGGCGAACSP